MNTENKTPIKIDQYFMNARTRFDLIDLIPNDVTRVLEIGCGIGKTGKALFEKKQCKIVGLDISDQVISIANQQNCYEKLIVADLDQSFIPTEIENEKFDCILYPDVLEHLKDPWKVVNIHTNNLLNANGYLIASIPNIRHFSILKDLFLKGNWQYQNMGILDRTHLRFFTKKTMVNLFQQSDNQLTINLVKSRGLSGPKYLKMLNKLMFNYLEELLTIQYLIVAQKKE